jgi:hypothetical protein
MSTATARKGKAPRGAVNTSPPYRIVWWDNPAWMDDEPVDERLKSALQWVERETGIKVLVVQGCYKAKYGGGANASAHTHDEGGVVDVAVKHLSRWQRIRLAHAFKRAGFAQWYRRGPGWVGNEHFHCVLRGHRNLHPEAAAQVVAYDARRNGLVSNLLDRTWRPKVKRRWSHRQNKPILGK